MCTTILALTHPRLDIASVSEALEDALLSRLVRTERLCHGGVMLSFYDALPHHQPPHVRRVRAHDCRSLVEVPAGHDEGRDDDE